MKILMKYGFGLLFIGLVLTSCTRRFVPTSTIITKDSIIYKDSIIKIDVPVTIPGDTIVIRDTIQNLPKNIKASNTLKKGHTSASYRIENGIIDVECNIAPYQDTIRQLEAKVRTLENYHYKQEKIAVPVQVIKYKIPRWVLILLGFEVLAVGAWLWMKGYLGVIFEFFSKIFKN